MKSNVAPVIDTIVNTLLHVGDRVVEVSGDGTIGIVWQMGGGILGPVSEDLYGKKISEVGDDILKQCAPLISESFVAGQDMYRVFTATVDNNEVVYSARVLHLHPEQDKLFLVTQLLPAEERPVVMRQMPDTDARFQKLKNFYERILNSISADVIVLDSEYRFLYVNPASIRSEATRQWLIGKTDEEFFRYKNMPVDLASRRRKMYDAARNERKVIEWVEKSRTLLGTMKNMLRRIYPVFDIKGNLEIIIGYSMNITELITVQEELKTSRDIFQSAFHDSGIGLAMLSPEGDWIDVNAVLCGITGYSREEFMNLKMSDLTFPDDLEEHGLLVKRLLLREISSASEERRYISKQGSVINVLFTLSLVWDQDDIPKFFIAQVVDITKKNELEEEVKHKNEELEATKIKLVNRVAQLEELSYIVAHNLRGPAANIKLLTESLLGQKPNNGESSNLSGQITVDEGLSFIQDASNSLMNSLASLMKIAEIKLNKDVPYNKCVFSDFVGDIAKQLQSKILNKKAVLHLSFDVESIQYPKAYLESILYNLISNALKYCRPGVPPVISLTTRKTGNKIQLLVKDNGLGINLDKYADRVFKLNQVFHAGYDSKGFGLYLTKTQIESLGGTITLVSKLNEGTEFTVTF